MKGVTPVLPRPPLLGWAQGLRFAKVGGAALLLLAGAGCAWLSNEGYRTQRAFDASVRGEETYGPPDPKPVQALNDLMTRVYAERMAILIAANKADQDRLHHIIGLRAGSSLAPQPPAKTDGETGSLSPESPGASKKQTGQPPETAAGSGTSPDAERSQGAAPVHRVSPGPNQPDKGLPGAYSYFLTKYWPEKDLGTVLERVPKGRLPDVVRELDDVLMKQFIRDLVTEPSFVTAIPTTRKVTLSCTPPPEQSVIQTAASLAASLDYKGAKVGVDARLAESLVKLFEQTERTVFLQYVMFRLCEMSLNNSGEFRNVFPLVMQELVRESATLSLQQVIETEKAKQADSQAKAEMAKGEGQRLACVKAQQQRKPDVGTDDLNRVCGPAPTVSVADRIGGGPLSPAQPAEPAQPGQPAPPGGGGPK